MDDSNQIDVPPSFTALFASPGGHRLTEPMSHVRTRYELCEDLAQMLTEQAVAQQFKTGGSGTSVLAGMQTALGAEGSPVEPREARWVIRRLAELLDWPAPAGNGE